MGAVEAWAKPGNQPARPLPQTPGGGAKPMTDILDIKGPVALPGGIPWLWILAGAAALLLLAGLGWLLWRRLKRPAPEAPAPAPEELALADLADLEADLDAEKADSREFYFRLSGVVRGYLEERTGERMLEMTTEEVVGALPRLGLSTELSGGVRELLRGSDPVRYAGAAAAVERMRRDLDFARRLVRELAPPDEDEGEAPGVATEEAG
jgi:hypothetical protein